MNTARNDRHITNVYGREQELRILRIVNEMATEVTWLESARLATADEDARGVDIVTTTDVGSIRIQVKSSRAGYAKFHKKRRRRNQAIDPLLVMIITGEKTNEQLADQTYDELLRVRDIILRAMGKIA